MEKEQKWMRLLAEQKRSGKSVSAFCKEQGVAEGSFQYWRSRLGKKEEVSSFVRITKESAPIEIIVSERIRVLIPAATSTEDIRKFLETADALNS